MTQHFTVRKLLWLDCIAAFTSAVIVFSFRGFFASLFNLPETLLLTLSVIAFAYGCYSFSLTQRRQHSLLLLWILVTANLLYAISCFVLLLVYFDQSSGWGVSYFLLDIIIVATLVVIEWRTFKSTLVIQGT